jgi:hypothetical protein
MPKSTEIAVPDESANDLIHALPAGMDVSNFSYDELASSGQLYQIPGFGLVSDKDDLMGVPHIVVGVTYQKPVPRKGSPYNVGDYVTLRAIVGGQSALDEAQERGWIPGKLMFKPNELICYNDGSTGIRRQVTTILDNAGLIKVGDEVLEGVLSKYDKPWTQWESFSQYVEQGSMVVPEFANNHAGNQFLLKVDRGLRKSTYSNDYTDDGVTYYL